MKKQNTISCGFAIASLFLAGSAFADNKYSPSGGAGLSAGDWLVGFSGSYNYLSTDEGSLSAFTVNVDASYFLEDNISVGLNTFGIFIPSAGLPEDSGYAIGFEPNLRYYFPNDSPYLPYVGVHGGLGYLDFGDDSETIGTYGLAVGVVVPIGESSYFNAELKWTEFETSDDVDLNLTAIQVLLGFKVKF